MSSIYIKAAAFLYRGDRSDDLHHSIPFLVFHRGLFDCIAPRIEHILTRERGHTSRVLSVASNACTFHLTREVWFVNSDENDIQTSLAALRKLTQVASLTLARSDSGKASIDPVFSEVMRFASTLVVLRCYCDLDDENRLIDTTGIEGGSSTIAELHNLQELKVSSLTRELCGAIAAGPGARLRQLTVNSRSSTCQSVDIDVVVAGCPNIWALSLGICTFDFVLSASKLQYLQALRAVIDASPLETDMHTAFGNMQRLTKLDVSVGSLTGDFSTAAAAAAIIATTIGPQLVEFSFVHDVDGILVRCIRHIVLCFVISATRDFGAGFLQSECHRA